MRIDRSEAARTALALDTAITCMESLDAVIPKGVSKAQHADSLIHLRALRSAALRANREAPAGDSTAFHVTRLPEGGT